jgi:hypothetical protein
MICLFSLAGFTAGGVVAYTPPCAVVYEGKGSFVQTELLAVPSGPGQALVFTAGVTSAAKVKTGDVLKALVTNPKTVPMLLIRWEQLQTRGWRNLKQSVHMCGG